MAAATSLVFRVLGVDAGASATIRKVGLEAEAAGGKFEALGSKLKKFSLGAAAAVIGVGAASVKMAMDFDQSMARLNTQAHVPQAAIKGLSAGVLDLAGKVGVGPNSLAQALYHIESSFASTGISSKKAMDLLKVAAEGAKIGGSDLVDTTNAIDAAVVSGIPGVQNFTQAMGALNATVGSGDMSMQDLAEALGGGVLAVIKNYGVTLNDASAALATFGDNNIRGADAGTALRMAVQSLAVPARTGKAEIAAMGLKMDTLAKDMQAHGLNFALQDLITHMTKAGITGNEIGQALTEAFGKKAGVGLAVLVAQFDRFQSKYKEVHDQSQSFGADWANQQKQFKQQWDQLSASLQATGVKLGNWLIPKIQDTITWLGKHKAASNALKVALGVGLVGALTAATAGAVAFTASLLTNPIFLFIAALEAAGVAGFELGYHWSQVWAGIKHVTIVGVKAVVDLFLSMAGAVVHAADWAFGWIPGIGPKLDRAAKAFDQFKANVNASLEGIISSRTVTVTAQANFVTQDANGTYRDSNGNVVYGPVVPGALFKGSGTHYGPVAKAAGGPIYGPGTGTSDSIPARLSNGEFVVRASQASKHMGLLHAINTPGFAAGGVVVVPHTNTAGFAKDAAAWSSTLDSRAVHAYSGVIDRIAAQVAGMFGGGGGATSSGANVALGARMAAMVYGWTGAMFDALNKLWTRESGWNNYARNPSSGAFGIPQALPPGKMGAAAVAGDAASQIMWGLQYIYGRYGNPINAWAHETADGWYAMGGRVGRSGVYRVGEAGAENVYLPQGALVASHRDSMGGSHVVVNITGPVYSDSAGIKRLMNDIDREIARSGNNVPATFRR